MLFELELPGIDKVYLVLDDSSSNVTDQKTVVRTSMCIQGGVTVVSEEIVDLSGSSVAGEAISLQELKHQKSLFEVGMPDRICSDGVPVDLTSVTREMVFYRSSPRVCTTPFSIGKDGGIIAVIRVS